ncbi:MAG TPA: GtrA family protein [Trebonia sp.]|nr:GtrA family protein [Trebonia sp.]
MARAIADLYERIRHLVPELAKFGVVGGIGAVVDLGGAAVLQYHVGPLKAKAISITAATIITYVGSRFWTFRHRENQAMHREAVLFIVLNVIGLILAEAVIGLTTYVLGLKGPLAYNAASVVGTGLGTIFRFYAYRKWVFLAPDEQSAQQVPASARADDMLDYAPWELDPTFFDQRVGYSRQPVPEDPFIPNESVAPPLVAAAAPARETPVRGNSGWDIPARESSTTEMPRWESRSWEEPNWEAPAWQGGKALEEPVLQAPTWEDQTWEAPRPMPSATAEDASQRAPGRHRKPR